MIRSLAFATALVILIGAGYLHGLATGRWTPRGDNADAIARLQDIPLQFGEWRGEAQPMNLEELAGAGIRGGITRTYTHSKTGERLTMMILYGKANQLSVHTPDVCYPAAGYEQVGGAGHIRVTPEPPSQEGMFWVNTFRKPDRPTLDELTVHYAWGVDGGWKAPQGDARLSFAWYPGIYKLYVVRAVDKPNGPTSGGPSEAFLEAALPGIEQALFPSSSEKRRI
jgi:hypothetical protein